MYESNWHSHEYENRFQELFSSSFSHENLYVNSFGLWEHCARSNDIEKKYKVKASIKIEREKKK